MLYESTIHPITILSTLPSAGVGALLALMLCKTDFSIIALIGIILLIGIVKKNAIMMIDFALEVEREEGLSPRDSIYKACLLRFRPILMTTLAALLGARPPGGRHGHRLRAAQAPRHRHRRRAHRSRSSSRSSRRPSSTSLLDRFSRDKTIPPPSSRELPPVYVRGLRPAEPGSAPEPLV